MGSRENILSAVKANQPAKVELPGVGIFETEAKGSPQQFAAMVTTVGGQVVSVSTFDEIIQFIVDKHGRNITFVNMMSEISGMPGRNLDDLGSIHDLHDVDFALLEARFGVAENGAVWFTDNEMRHRVLPFVTQHLGVVIKANSIVPTMHQAYKMIGNAAYGFGTFIAGPSKTADIEQSLVIGAHGPRSMTVFVLS